MILNPTVHLALAIVHTVLGVINAERSTTWTIVNVVCAAGHAIVCLYLLK